MLRHQSTLKKLLIKHGADQVFAQDYIYTKLLGHLFELVGTATIVDPKNNFVEVDFEGFFLEVTVGLISDSLQQFKNHFASRQMRRYAGIEQFIIDLLNHAGQLLQYTQYLIDVRKHKTHINSLIQQDPLLIPVGYEGHAITFIRYGDVWVKCDRREDSRLFDNIMFYRMTNYKNFTKSLLLELLYNKQSSEFINEDLDSILGLQPITELKIEAQISGNCSWANVEAVIPALFFLVLMKMNPNETDLSHFKSLAISFFHQWREWNKDRALYFCIESFKEADAVRKACKAEILAAVLFQCCRPDRYADQVRIETILSLLMNSPYEYLIKDYLRVYLYENYTDEGKQFAQLLRSHGYLK